MDDRALGADTWPQEQLESLQTCPVCGGERMRPLVEEVGDWAFEVAPGRWRYLQCEQCWVAYLCPRPTKQSIHLAYQSYYTHAGVQRSRLAQWIRALYESIANTYYACLVHKQAHWLARATLLAYRLIPPLRLFLDAKARHLMTLSGAPGKLLDMGCGNGDFMLIAQRLGWEVEGIDLDPKAVEAVRAKGLRAQLGDLDLFDQSAQVYDLITVSHVIEHVYEPKKIVADCFRLLRQRGRLWVETPNVESASQQYYGRYWRGWEAPRHLIVFNHNTLQELLRGAGFSRIQQQIHGLAGLFMAVTSEQMRRKALPAVSRWKALIEGLAAIWRALRIEWINETDASRREFITILAEKPAAPAHPPLVSIGIPTYNAAQYIEKTIQSALNQTYTNLELVIVDDCSTDATVEIIRALNDPRITLHINEKNLGPTETWSRTLSLAQGAYFKLLCHDDVLYPESIERQVEILAAEPSLVMVAANRDIIDAQGELLMRPRRFKQTGSVPGQCLLRRSIVRGTNIIGEPHAVLFRMDSIRAHEITFGTNFYMIDLGFYAQVLMHGPAYLMQECLSAFRVSADSASYKMARRQAQYFIEYVEELKTDERVRLTSFDLLRAYGMARYWQFVKFVYYQLLRLRKKD